MQAPLSLRVSCSPPKWLSPATLPSPHSHYRQPFLLCENATGKLADFTTSFNFAISYNSTSKNLSVAFTTFISNTSDTQVMKHFYYIIDLKQYLPDWVVVGFSASTGKSVALFKILSWNFNSTSLVDLHQVDTATDNTSSVVAVPALSPVASAYSPKPGNDRRIGLAIGISITGFAVLVGGLGLVWFILWRKRGTGDTSDEDPMVNELKDDEFEKGAMSSKRGLA